MHLTYRVLCLEQYEKMDGIAAILSYLSLPQSPYGKRCLVRIDVQIAEPDASVD